MLLLCSGDVLYAFFHKMLNYIQAILGFSQQGKYVNQVY